MGRQLVLFPPRASAGYMKAVVTLLMGLFVFACTHTTHIVKMVDKFSDAEIAEFKEAFCLFDKDGDGKINTTEIGTVMRSLGHMPTEEEVGNIVKSVKNKSVDFPEFLSILAKTAKPAASEG